jgi:hypothetical protein
VVFRRDSSAGPDGRGCRFALVLLLLLNISADPRGRRAPELVLPGDQLLLHRVTSSARRQPRVPGLSLDHLIPQLQLRRDPTRLNYPHIRTTPRSRRRRRT